MAQNRHNAVIHLGHQNGTVTLWTPNLPHPAVQLLAHLGPVVSVSIDQSTGGRFMSTAGQDGTVKVWDCRNWKGAVREWSARGGGGEVEWSGKGSLAVASGGSANVSVFHITALNEFIFMIHYTFRFIRHPLSIKLVYRSRLHRYISHIPFHTARSLHYGFAHSKIY